MRVATRPAFFAFADTVSARNFQGTNECHGWMGIKFQAHPRDEDSQIIIHVRMLDGEAALQQEALGHRRRESGVRRIRLNHEPDQLVDSLLDGLSTSRIEIDMIEFSGIAFRHVDNRLMSLQAGRTWAERRGDVCRQRRSAATVGVFL